MGSEQQAGWQRQLRTAGLAEAELEACIKEAVRQFRAVLDDETGRWLLGPRQDAASEYGVTGVIDGTLTSVRLDRTFEHEGERWIIDYKTGLAATDDSSIDALSARHRPQLARYRTCVKACSTSPSARALPNRPPEAHRDLACAFAPFADRHPLGSVQAQALIELSKPNRRGFPR